MTMFVAPGPLVTIATPGTTRREGVALGHVTGALLVSHEDMTNGGVDQRVIDGKNGAAGQAEDRVDPLLFEALDKCLRSCELHHCPLFLDKQKGLPCLGGLQSTCERDYRRQAPTTTRISFRVVTLLSLHTQSEQHKTHLVMLGVSGSRSPRSGLNR